MNKVLFLLFMTAATAVKAQNPCKKHCKLPLAKRMEIYPFQKNCSVWLVSFPEYDFYAPTEVGRSMPLPPFTKGKLDTAKFSACKQLSRAGIDSLSELFYCYGDQQEVSERGCGKSHQAILFVDKNSMIYSYICFCFDEHSYQPSSNSFGIGDWCDTKLDMIHQFFVREGIEE